MSLIFMKIFNFVFFQKKYIEYIYLYLLIFSCLLTNCVMYSTQKYRSPNQQINLNKMEEYLANNSNYLRNPSHRIGVIAKPLTVDTYGEIPGSFSDTGRFISYVYSETLHNPDSLKGTLWIMDLKHNKKTMKTKHG